MPATQRSPQSDPLEDRFRLDTVPAGTWVTFLLCAAGLIYALAYADADHRGVLVALLVACAVAGGVVTVLPWERIVRSRWREAAFMSWSVADFALIATVAAIDGGGDSPLALAFFIPIVFTALSYPRWGVVTIGVLAVAGYVVLAAASGTDTGYALMFASSLASIALMAVWQAHNHDRWRETLSTASRTDPLTGALNRRGFEDAANVALAASGRDGRAVALLVLDLDHFKAYNDEHGHVAGDHLLRHVARSIETVLRPGDTVARIGGDEFAVLLPGAGQEVSAVVAQRIDEALNGVPHSLGVGCTPPETPELDPLYRAADTELYAVKARHRRERPPVTA
jgi:diguanylate cyclase (GGDEF)-like protein